MGGRSPVGVGQAPVEQHTTHRWMGRGGGPGPVTTLTPISLHPVPQESAAVPSVGAWAIGSPTAPNSRRCRPSRSATSAARTTWPIAPWTSSCLLALLSKRPPSLGSSCLLYMSPLGQKPVSSAQLAWSGPGCTWLPALWTPVINILAPLSPLKHKLLESQPLPCLWPSPCLTLLSGSLAL